MSVLTSTGPALPALPVVMLVGVMVLLAIATVLSTPAQAGPPSSFILLADRSSFAGAEVDGLVWQGEASQAGTGRAGWVLNSTGIARGYGQLTTAVLSFKFPVTEVVASWNVQTPPNSYLRVEVRALSPNGMRTPWYCLGVWPGGVGKPAGWRRDVTARVNEDTLVLTEPAQQVQLRATLYASPGGLSPSLSLLSLVGSLPLLTPPPSTADDSTLEPAAAPLASSGTLAAPAPAAWGKVLPVPFRSQRVEDPSIAGRICGPTSLSMVLEYYGRNFPTAVVAQIAYDQLNGIHGNWPFLAATAAEAGLTAYVTRFSGWEGVEQEILAGHPVIISIHFGPDELPGAPIRSTDGHLLVVRGFTATGDILVNDPAAWSASEGQITYDRQALLRAWDNGVAIVVTP